MKLIHDGRTYTLAELPEAPELYSGPVPEGYDFAGYYTERTVWVAKATNYDGEDFLIYWRDLDREEPEDSADWSDPMWVVKLNAHA